MSKAEIAELFGQSMRASRTFEPRADAPRTVTGLGAGRDLSICVSRRQSAPLIFVRMHPDVRRDLALLRLSLQGQRQPQLLRL
jgi:hypothetical protein